MKPSRGLSFYYYKPHGNEPCLHNGFINIADIHRLASEKTTYNKR